MSEGSKPVLEITGTLDVRPADIAQRLQNIEEKLAGATSKPKDFWDKLQASGATGILSSILIALVGFMLTGAISNSLQERQLELTSVEKMQSLISTLSNPMVSEQDENVDTTTLAAFGKSAVPAFVTFLGTDTPTSLRIADRGLHMLGSAHPSWVCANLTSILRNRSGLYSWRTFRHTLDLAGDLNCQSSRDAIEEFRIATKDLEQLNGFITTSAAQKDFDDLRAKTDSILDRLNHAPKASRWRGIKQFMHVSATSEVEEAG